MIHTTFMEKPTAVYKYGRRNILPIQAFGKIWLLALHLLLSLCPFSLSGAIATPNVDIFSNFHFFYYVVTWPGASCSRGNGCCLPTTRAPELDFFVKGLYPYKKNWWGTWDFVTNCRGSSFAVDELKNLTRSMEAYWADIDCPCNNGLSNWENIWGTFGTCSMLTPNDYFKKALELRSKLNLLKKLRQEHIWPRDEKDYPSNVVHDTIDNAVGQPTAIVCTEDELDPRFNPMARPQLQEIWLCVDKDATTIIPCPVLPPKSCRSRLYFSTFTYEKMRECPSDPIIELPTVSSE